jgi:hypothetical protein
MGVDASCAFMNDESDQMKAKDDEPAADHQTNNLPTTD